MGIPPQFLGFKPMISAIKVGGSIALSKTHSRQSYPFMSNIYQGNQHVGYWISLGYMSFGDVPIKFVVVVVVVVFHLAGDKYH